MPANQFRIPVGRLADERDRDYPNIDAIDANMGDRYVCDKRVTWGDSRRLLRQSDHVNPRPKLVSTGVAARELGVDRVTLARWWRSGLVEPTFVTAGGHARWDVDKLRNDINQMRRGES